MGFQTGECENLTTTPKRDAVRTPLFLIPVSGRLFDCYLDIRKLTSGFCSLLVTTWSSQIPSTVRRFGLWCLLFS